MLTKDLLRVSRAGGGFHPQFAGEGDEGLAARVIGAYRGHVGEPRSELTAALEDLEREAGDFKLVRGFAKLLERESTFEVRATVDPERARRRAFEAGEAIGVATASEREEALARATEGVDATPTALAESLYADREEREVLTSVDAPWDPPGLLAQYNLSLAQTALFDATEVRIRSSDPKALVSAVKRLRLMYEVERTGEGREVVVTGPDALFGSTRRYGTRFARLLRTVATAGEWRLEATIDDRGTERLMVLSDDDPVRVPGTDPVVEVEFDSAVEADFAARFESLDLDWLLSREPEPLETGARVMIPDFAFDYAHADFRVYFEIVGFWTPEYVEKKLDQLERVEDVELIVAVDETLGIGEDVAGFDHRVVPFSGAVRVKDVRDALRTYEEELTAEAASAIPDYLVPDPDIVALETIAADYGVGVEAIEGKRFPEHELVGRTLIRPAVLSELGAAIEPETTLEEVDELLATYGIEDASAILAELGYRVEWEGLGGGVVRPLDG